MDVTAGLAWAFQEAGCETTVYMHLSLLGLQSVMASWFTGELRPRHKIDKDQQQYDVLVLVTFPEGPTQQDRQQRLLFNRPPGQRILLGVHNPGWVFTAAWPGAPQLLAQLAFPRSPGGGGRKGAQQQEQRLLPPPVQLLSLAPIGSAYAKSLFQSWLASARGWDPQLAGLKGRLDVPWIAPLVPWAPSDAAALGGSSGNGSGGSGSSTAAGLTYDGPVRHVCIQGSIHPKRRNYAGAFAAAAHPAVLAQLRARSESLLLVGNNRKNASLPVPPELRPYIQILSSLSYSDYYDTLSRCRAILTAFSTDQYLVNKTSSTLAAALLVGAPLLTEGRVLAAYEYVPEAAAFLYTPLNDTAQPDPAALAKAEAKRLSQWMRQWAAEQAKRREGAVMRRLGEVLGSATAERQGKEEEEEDEEAARWLAWAQAGRQGLRQRHQPRRQQREQEDGEQPAPAGNAAAEPTLAGDAGLHDLPPPGSYAAAMLRAFDDGAARAAHSAAWRAKQALMRRNAETARQALREAAALAAAVRAAG
ncbi:hypothetical protein ABPG75_008491 [Micractinium tetrahymenae]